MADPLSFTASIIAIATLSMQTCSGLYQCFKSVTEAPKELEHHVSTLRTLEITFAGIAKLEQDAFDISLLSPGFGAHLQECLLDLQAMEGLVMPFFEKTNCGRKRRHWAKVRWASFDQRHKLQKLLEKIHAHQSTFSLDLLLLNANLGLRSNQKTLQTSVGVSDRSSPCFTPTLNQKSIPNIQNHPLQSVQLNYVKEPAVRNLFTTRFKGNYWSSLLWCGSVTTKSTHQSQISHIPGSKSPTGCGFSIATVHSSPLAAFRFQIAVYIIKRNYEYSLSFGLNSSLSIQRVIPWNSPIVDFILAGDILSIQGVFSRKCFTPYDVFPDGISLLQLACTNENLAIVQLLLNEGADVNALNKYGESPLHSAIELNRQFEITRLLLNHGADLNSRDIAGMTPLHTFYTPVVEEVLRYHRSDIDFGSRDEYGWTVLHYLAWSSISPSSSFQSHQAFLELDGSKVDNRGRGLLHLAAERGNISVIEYLLDKNPWMDVNSLDYKLNTPLHYAVYSKRACETIDSLVQRGANLDAKDIQGNSVLHAAIIARNQIAIEKLRDLGVGEEQELTDSDKGDLPIDTRPLPRPLLHPFLHELHARVTLGTTSLIAYIYRLLSTRNFRWNLTIFIFGFVVANLASGYYGNAL